MALIYLDDNDPWITEYDVCEKLYDDIMEQLNQRQSKPKASLAFASLSANVRIQMNQYSDHIIQLKKKIAEALKLRLITVDEAERRTRQIEQLQSNYVKIKRFYDLKMNPTSSERPSLFSNSSTAFAEGGIVGWDDQNDQSDSNISIADIKSQNQAALLEQERGLDELYKVITRQKTIAQTINTEVDHQNEIIDDLAEHMEQTDERLIDGTRQIRFIDRKDRTCGYWVVIILLFISIICVAVV